MPRASAPPSSPAPSPSSLGCVCLSLAGREPSMLLGLTAALCCVAVDRLLGALNRCMLLGLHWNLTHRCSRCLLWGCSCTMPLPPPTRRCICLPMLPLGLGRCRPPRPRLHSRLLEQHCIRVSSLSLTFTSPCPSVAGHLPGACVLPGHAGRRAAAAAARGLPALRPHGSCQERLTAWLPAWRHIPQTNPWQRIPASCCAAPLCRTSGRVHYD